MKTDEAVFLLFLDDRRVRWSKASALLDAAIRNRTQRRHFALDQVVVLRLSAEMAKHLQPLSCPDVEAPAARSAGQLAQLDALKLRPEKTGAGAQLPQVWVAFRTDGSCRWQPTKDALDALVAGSTEKCISGALPVSLAPHQHRALMGHLEWAQVA